MKGLCRSVVATQRFERVKSSFSIKFPGKAIGLFGKNFRKEGVDVAIVEIHMLWGTREVHKTMEQFNNNHPFNLKQREILSKLLAQARARAEVNLESDDSVDHRVKAEVLPKLAEERGAMPLVVKLRDLRKQVDYTEENLQKLGFDCDEDSISLRWNAPNDLSEAMAAAKRAAREERNKVLKKYDLAILDVWATADVAAAKGIVEKLL